MKLLPTILALFLCSHIVAALTVEKLYSDHAVLQRNKPILGKPCIVGCAKLTLDPAGRAAQIAGRDIHEGDWLSIDGETGAIYMGQGKVVVEQSTSELEEIARWQHAAASRGEAAAAASKA